MVFQIEDESMLPFYAPQDYVGGVILSLDSPPQETFSAIVTLTSDDKSIKRVTYNASTQKYFLSSTNPLYQSAPLMVDTQEIIEIAKIVWHRKVG